MWSHHFVQFGHDCNLKINDQGGWIDIDNYLIKVNAGYFRSLKFTLFTRINSSLSKRELQQLIEEFKFKLIKITGDKIVLKVRFLNDSTDTQKILKGLSKIIEYLTPKDVLTQMPNIENFVQYDSAFVKQHKRYTEATKMKLLVLFILLVLTRIGQWVQETYFKEIPKVRQSFEIVPVSATILLSTFFYLLLKKKKNTIWYAFSGVTNEEDKESFLDMLMSRFAFLGTLYCFLVYFLSLIFFSTNLYKIFEVT